MYVYLYIYIVTAYRKIKGKFIKNNNKKDNNISPLFYQERYYVAKKLSRKCSLIIATLCS